MTKPTKNIQTIFHKASSNRKLYVFLFCLLLATFFWLLNSLGNQYTTTVNFVVNYKNAPKNKVILNDLPSNLNIKVKGLGFDLLAYKLSFTPSEVTIDLSKFKELSSEITKENYTLPASAYLPHINNQLGDKIDIKAITPNSIYFSFDAKVEKMVKIIPVTQLAFKQQYKQFGGIEMKPAITKVSGPASVMDTLSEVYTEKLTLNNLFETVTIPVTFNSFYEKQKLTFYPNKALVHIPVEQFTESSIQIAIDYINVPEGMELKAIPSEVELKFLLPLSKMASLPNANFRAEVNYNQINDNFNQKLKVEMVNYPDYIQIVTQQPSKVEYILKRK